MISSDYSSDDDEIEEDSMVVQPSKKLPIIIFRAEVAFERSKKLKSIGERHNMRFKFQRGGTSLIRAILAGFGFRECNENSIDYNVLWMNSHVKPFSLRNMLEFQKVNHFPRSFELTRKDRLARNVERMAQSKSAKLFDFVPKSFLMPSEYQDFCQAAVRDKGPWIVKPIASSRGRGIYLVNNPNQVPLDDSTMVCKYLANPLLIDGFKFDIRLYVGVTSYDPLIVYLYEEGLVRFATIKYDMSNRHIKNQWMHLTNYSINKRNNDYVKSDDADQEDFGNKWTLGALLRYLREGGVDTKTLMSRIEQVILKSIISVENPIAQATKMFVPFRGNCSELYGFDILIDDNLKPWVLEVNLSPSLATDAPLDLKIKSNLICDFFNLMGVEAVDPAQSRRVEPKSRAQPFLKNRINSSNQSSQNGNSSEKPASSPGLSPEDAKLIKWVKDQHSRRGGFVRIFPRAETWAAYGGLLDFKTHTNELLAARLFPDTYRAGAAVIRSKATQEKMMCKNEVISGRFYQYERKLLALDSKERRKERRKIRRVRKNRRHKKRIEITSDLDELDEEEHEEEEEKKFTLPELKIVEPKVPIPPGEPVPPQYIQKSEIYQSIRSSKLNRNEIGQGDRIDNTQQQLESRQEPVIEVMDDVEPKKDDKLDISLVCDENKEIEEPAFNLQDIVSTIKKRARDLCQIEAREAFATYLLRVQQRFMVEANQNRGRSHDKSDQIELVCRFLTRASGNLEVPLELNLPDPTVTPITERKKIIGNLLIDFIQRYNKETETLINHGQKTSSNIAPHNQFQFFLKFCCEQEVEDILTIYTQENKSASVFLGAKKAKNKNQSETASRSKTHDDIVKNASIKVKENDGLPVTSEPAISRKEDLGKKTDLLERRRAISQDRSRKLLNRPTSTNNSPFEQSVRGAAYIYTAKARNRPSRESSGERPRIKPSTSDANLQAPRSSSTASAVPTTANEAIRLALKKLAERSGQDKDTQRVSHLAQQLAKLNQNAARNGFHRPSSATIHRNTKYSSKYRNASPYGTQSSKTVIKSEGLSPVPTDATPVQSTVKETPIVKRGAFRPKSAHSTCTNQHTRVCWK